MKTSDQRTMELLEDELNGVVGGAHRREGLLSSPLLGALEVAGFDGKGNDVVTEELVWLRSQAT